METSFVYGLNFAQSTLEANLREISNEDSMQQIENINCINWLLGHIVTVRQSWIQRVRPGYSFYEPLSSQYRTGGYFNADNANTIEQLLTWQQQQQKILIEIAEKDDIGNKDVFISYMLHELYHVGQIGTVRKLIGKGSGVGI